MTDSDKKFKNIRFANMIDQLDYLLHKEIKREEEEIKPNRDARRAKRN